MTQIMIHLEREPGGHPVGRLTTGAGRVVAFTGWLHLIRLLEEELDQAPRPDGVTSDPHQEPRP